MSSLLNDHIWHFRLKRTIGAAIALIVSVPRDDFHFDPHSGYVRAFRLRKQRTRQVVIR